MRSLLILIFISYVSPAMSFESDVHYGLTNWLALQAGFDPEQARIIATFDQRVDSGDMPFIDVVALYACLGKDAVSARRAGEHHYPSDGSIPGSPETRNVTPNSKAARRAVLKVMEINANQSQYRLSQLGEALHILQDSWANQGVPTLPKLGDAASTCDSGMAWGHSAARGGSASHRADLTMYWPADTVAMAQATYEVLENYPLISDAKRNAQTWQQIRPALDDFIMASTKTEKARWFSVHGVDDVSFLEGTSLPDGTEAFVQHWSGRKLPQLTSDRSSQAEIEHGLLDFYGKFFERWLSTNDFAAVVDEFSAVSPTNARTASTLRKELESRLKLWRLRDHGRVADLSLKIDPLTDKERAVVDEAANAPDAYTKYEPLASAYFPLLPAAGKSVSPLLPFFIGQIAPDAERPRAIAVTKFRHAPYDVVGVVSENVDGQWRLISIVSTVDH